MRQDQVIGIFPTPIMKIEKVLNDEILNAVVEQSKISNTEKNTKSDLLSHTQVVDPASDVTFCAISECVNPKLTEFGELLFGERLDWTIKEMWVNILRPGGQQAMHSHANSFVSGIIYLTDFHPSTRTIFYRNVGGFDYTFSNNNPNAALGPFNAPKWAIPKVVPGDMILFPSYLLHEVPKNLGEQRMTIALNALPNRLRSWDYEVRFT